MTKLFRFTPAARADLVGIWDYTARHWDPDQADRYIDELQRHCLALAADEAASRPVELRPGTRKAQAGSHMVYFREDARVLDVTRILHQRQDADRHF